MALQVIYGNQIGNRILVGITGDKPGTGSPTEIFIDTTLNTLERGTGSGWQKLTASTSAELIALMSDETGSGALVFGTSPNITTPTGIAKGDVGLGNVDNTSDANKPVSTSQQTALDLKLNLTGGTISGNIVMAGAETIDGRDLSVDGSKLDGIESLAEVNNVSDSNAADLTDTGDSALHYHASDRLIANISDSYTHSSVNLLKNSNFESWSAGTSTAPDTWASFGAGHSITRDAVNYKKGVYGVALTRSGANSYIINDTYTDFEYFKSRDVSLGVWVKTSTAGQANLVIEDGSGSTVSSNHSGSGNWEWLTVTRTISAGATLLRAQVRVTNIDGTAYFDSPILVEGFIVPASSPKPLEDDGKTIVINSDTNIATIENVTIGQTLIKSTTNGITAYAGGGQANAVALASDINEVSVCATGGDSTKLPAAVAGMGIVVINHGAAAMDLFPFSGDYINEAAVDTATSIAMDATAICYCYIADYWEVVEVGR